MLCPINEEIENDYEQDVESELMQVVLGMQDAKPQSVPMVGNIEDREPLPQFRFRV